MHWEFKQTENIRKFQTEITELKNVSKLRNTLEMFNSRLNEAEERISELEARAEELTQSKQQRQKRMKKSEDSLRDIWNNINKTNICIIGIPEKRRTKGGGNIFEEIMAEKFPNLGK